MTHLPNAVVLVAGLIAAIGALNWGLTGVLNFNLVEKLLGGVPAVEKVAYGLVGIAGLVSLISFIQWAMSDDYKKKQ
jgi:uncharacterized membrane protein YuzA (DUF378 family)